MTYTVTVKGARPLTVNAVAKMHRQAWATHTREELEAEERANIAEWEARMRAEGHIK